MKRTDANFKIAYSRFGYGGQICVEIQTALEEGVKVDPRKITLLKSLAREANQAVRKLRAR